MLTFSHKNHPMNEESKNKSGQDHNGPLTPIGIFLGIFGLAVIAGNWFTHTRHGKIINLICGGLLLSIGIIAVLIEQGNKRSDRKR